MILQGDLLRIGDVQVRLLPIALQLFLFVAVARLTFLFVALKRLSCVLMLSNRIYAVEFRVDLLGDRLLKSRNYMFCTFSLALEQLFS